MLDLIEHLAQWVRGPLLIAVPGARRAARAAPELGRRRGATRPRILLEPLTASETRALVAALLPAGRGRCAPRAVAERSGGNPLFAEEMARRIAEEGGVEAAELPDTVQAVLAARLDSLEPFERTARAAGRRGRAHVLGGRAGAARRAPTAPRAGAGARRRCRRRTSSSRRAASRLAGERELAFKHVLIRDVAYGMLPKAVAGAQALRGRRRSSRSARATAPTRSWRCSPSTTAARRRSAARRRCADGRARAASARRALQFLEEAGDAAARAVREPRGGSRTTGTRAGLARDDEPATVARIGEKLGDVVAPARPRRRGDRASGASASSTTARRRTSSASPTCTARSARRCRTRASARRRSSTTRRASTCCKDGAAGCELVRLYEEAAWLYLHTGDNMLAIYASEKALRLAERLGETARRQPRARDLRPRVRAHRRHARRRARTSSARSSSRAAPTHGETILALLGAGRPPRGLRGRRTARRAGLRGGARRSRERDRRCCPPQVELHARARAARRLPRPNGRRSSASPRRAPTLAEREGLVGKLCFPYALRGLLTWRDGRLRRGRAAPAPRLRAGASRSAGRRSSSRP